MEITVEGWRAGREERNEAAKLSASDLPPLTDEQKAVARKMGISEESYARSTYAGRRSQDRLVEKTKRFARMLEKKLVDISGGAGIERVRLITIDHEFRIDISTNGRTVPFRVSEEMVDDLFEGGPGAIEEQIANRLQTVLAGQAA
jgi:hypothetical protein